MNVVDPKKSEYLNSTSTRKMSYYRERSLARAVSSRAVLVKADGNLAVGQYHDQYYSKETVARDLKASFSMKSMRRVDPVEADTVQRGLAKCVLAPPSALLLLSFCARLGVLVSSLLGLDRLRSASTAACGPYPVRHALLER